MLPATETRIAFLSHIQTEPTTSPLAQRSEKYAGKRHPTALSLKVAFLKCSQCRYPYPARPSLPLRCGGMGVLDGDRLRSPLCHAPVSHRLSQHQGKPGTAAGEPQYFTGLNQPLLLLLGQDCLSL